MIGPVRPANRVARALAETWMLFPAGRRSTARWMEAAGFADVRVRALAPDWYRDARAPYALAVSGVKPAPGPSPAAAPRRRPRSRSGRARFAGRSWPARWRARVFIPIAVVLDAARPRRREAR